MSQPSNTNIPRAFLAKVLQPLREESRGNEATLQQLTTSPKASLTERHGEARGAKNDKDDASSGTKAKRERFALPAMTLT